MNWWELSSKQLPWHKCAERREKLIDLNVCRGWEIKSRRLLSRWWWRYVSRTFLLRQKPFSFLQRNFSEWNAEFIFQLLLQCLSSATISALVSISRSLFICFHSSIMIHRIRSTQRQRLWDFTFKRVSVIGNGTHVDVVCELHRRKNKIRWRRWSNSNKTTTK